MTPARDEESPVFVISCGSSAFHPYECDGLNGCIHCAHDVTEEHDPELCHLCNWNEDMDDETGQLRGRLRDTVAMLEQTRAERDAAVKAFQERCEKALEELTAAYRERDAAQRENAATYIELEKTKEALASERDRTNDLGVAVLELQTELEQVRSEGVCSQAEYYRLRAVADAARERVAAKRALEEADTTYANAYADECIEYSPGYDGPPLRSRLRRKEASWARDGAGERLERADDELDRATATLDARDQGEGA